ncbi:hypothetical protein J6590_038755 [Homalodisca vitripennis]|nr:hypothetical protein J6590_038755 [Homalodisca vitripennis]
MNYHNPMLHSSSRPLLSIIACKTRPILFTTLINHRGHATTEAVVDYIVSHVTYPVIDTDGTRRNSVCSAVHNTCMHVHKAIRKHPVLYQYKVDNNNVTMSGRRLEPIEPVSSINRDHLLHASNPNSDAR